MNQRIVYTVFFVLVACTVWAQQPDPLTNPEQVAIRREEPRTPILTYNKGELAMQEDYRHSTYMQFLEGEWKVKRFASPMPIDTALLAPTIDLGSWETVLIPEKQGNGSWATLYRHEFKMPFAWIDREVFVHLGAVSRAYYVYVNGHQVGYFEDAKTAAEFNITKYVQEGKNHLAVIAYSDPVSTTLENQITTRGTAIDREVYIFSQPKVRIRDYAIDAHFAPDGTSGLFNLGVIVKSNLLNTKEVIVYYDIYGPDSTLVLSGKRDARFEMRSEDTVRFFANIPNIDSWSHESPKLYTVALRLQHEGRYTEYTTLKIGFRDIAFDRQGITLNGHPLELHAIDYSCPMEEATLCSDFLAFKRQGINLLRVERFPQGRRFYDLCDQYGLYVCDQANIDSHLSGESLRVGGTPANDTLWAKAYADRVLNMYYTSQNHPSVILFSLGKEAGKGYNMYEAYLRLKAVEHQRPVIYEGAGAEWNTDMVVGTPEGRNPSDDRYTLRFGSPKEYSNASPTPKPVVEMELLPLNEQVPVEFFQVSLKNGFKLTNLRNFNLHYTFSTRSKEVQSGVLCVNVAPDDRAEVHIPLESLKPGKYTLTLALEHRDTMPWAAKGEKIAERSFPVVVPNPPKAK